MNRPMRRRAGPVATRVSGRRTFFLLLAWARVKRFTVAPGGNYQARYLVSEEHISGPTRILVANEGVVELEALAAAASSVGAEVVARALRWLQSCRPAPQ